MHAKSDRYRPAGGEHNPQALDFHSHEVEWKHNGFDIILQRYCECAALGEARFQTAQDNVASVFKVDRVVVADEADPKREKTKVVITRTAVMCGN
jgi:hypothetical protein